MKATVALFSGAAIGAGLVYFVDPTSGKRRRALAKNTAAHGAKVIGRVVDIASRDTAHRLKGITEEAKGLFTDELVPDEILEDRIRTEVGRVSSHPNVQVMVREGCVMLTGPVIDSERRSVLKAAKSVRGVCGVIDRMEPYKAPEGTATRASRPRQIDILQSHWAPATRIFAGAAGAALIAAGMNNDMRRGALPRMAGLALLVRAATNMEFKRLLGIRAGRRAVDIQKTIRIAAPIDRVFMQWTNYENFPLFMSRVQEVRDLGDGRSHWSVTGPLGARLEWDAVTTEIVPNKLLAWRSEPGSLIQHSGTVHFESEHGYTRVQVRLSYNPPAGAIGHTIATLLGSNPKQEMDQDLVRMQTFLETGKRPHDAVHKLG